MKMLIATLTVSLLAAGAVRAEENGQTLYQQKCAACHQIEGQGLPHWIPPLAGSPILLSDEEELSALLLHGKAGMPAFHLFLDDGKIAAILSYARESWGNAAPPVTLATVAKVRQSLGGDGFKLPSN
jgi:cytochrome c oxidase cbb3-type subunit 2